MRTALRLVGLFLALGVLVFWLFGGPNLGWTKTSVLRIEKDPVTELEKRSYEDRFVPGVEFLAIGLVISGAVAGASFFFGRKQTHPPGTPQS